MKNVKVYSYYIPLAVMALLAGCHKDPAKVVPERALDRWNLLINHQPVKAYEYLSPGYRATHTLDQYVAFVATAKLKWKEAKVEGATCDADTCSVKLTIKSLIPATLTKTSNDVENESPLIEQWILNDGQWYLVPDSRIKTESDQRAPSASALQERTTATSSEPNSQSQKAGSEQTERKP